MVEVYQILGSFRYLEEELARRYRDAAPSTLLLLQNRCESVAAELKEAKAKLHATEDTASLRRAGNQALNTQDCELFLQATRPNLMVYLWPIQQCNMQPQSHCT